MVQIILNLNSNLGLNTNFQLFQNDILSLVVNWAETIFHHRLTFAN